MSTPTNFQPRDAANVVGMVSAAVGASKFREAYDLADTAIAQGTVHPILFNARGIWLEQQGRDEDALADFERSASLAPRNQLTLNAIGLCLMRLHRLDEAVAAFDEAIRVQPTFSSSYHRKGLALGLSRDFVAARRAHEEAAKLNPNDAEALSSLASLAARSGDKAKAGEYLARALRLNPRQPTALAAQALIANSDGRFEEAERIARSLLSRTDLSPHARAVAFGLLADALDGQNKPSESFAATAQENEELRRLHGPRFGKLRTATDFARGLADYFKANDPSSWRLPEEDRQDDAGSRHVFLLGFYRSGTTLLGQILASHPDIVTLEERDFLLAPAANYLSDQAGLARLHSLSEEELDAERVGYWQRVADSGIAFDGKILVDKQPLNTVKLPLLARLFPKAKIVFALRDPRDVVLSCFRRHFEINAAMYDLLTLDGAAGFYAAAMDLAETCRPMFSTPFFTYRYEDMISDFDGKVREICAFLDVPFDPGMSKFHGIADAQEIRSPSAMQVTRELYSEGIGQWRRYAEQLAPALPVLAPWIAKYGYPQD